MPQLGPWGQWAKVEDDHCLVAALVIWVLLRVGAKRPTARWAWVLVLLFVIVLVADVIINRVFGTNAKTTFSTAPPQKEEEK